MEKQSQQEIWNSIAPEWYRFKTEAGKRVEEFLREKKGKILDLGSGAGRNLIKLRSKDVDWHLVDFSEEMLKLAEKKAEKLGIKIKIKQSNLTKLPFQDDFFDSAIAIASVHCIKGEKNREKAVKELFRVLKPGAEAKIAVWNKNSRRFKNYKKKEKYVGWTNKGLRYYYLFDENEIYELFEKWGFKIKKKLEHDVNVDFVARKPEKFER